MILLRAGKVKPLRPLVIDVDCDGVATIAGMPIEEGGLQTLVSLLLGNNPRCLVRLRCDADLPFSRAAELLAVLKMVGLPPSSLLLETAPTPPARLDFRVAAMSGKDGQKPPLTEAELKCYRNNLQQHGPIYGQAAREQARRTACENALAGLIASLSGIEKASVRLDAPAPSGGEKPPTVNIAVSAETPRAGPLGKDLLQTVRVLVAAVVPDVEADEVKVVEAGAKPAADAKAEKSQPAAAEGPYAWFELDTEAPSPLVTAAHEGRKYVLLSLRLDDTMLAGDEGPRQWAVEDGSLGKSGAGRQAVQVTLDEAGAAHGGPGPVPSRRFPGRPHRRPRGLPAQDPSENGRPDRDRRRLRRPPGRPPVARALGAAGRGRRRHGCFAGGRGQPGSSGDGQWFVLTAWECDDEEGTADERT